MAGGVRAAMRVPAAAFEWVDAPLLVEAALEEIARPAVVTEGGLLTGTAHGDADASAAAAAPAPRTAPPVLFHSSRQVRPIAQIARGAAVTRPRA